MLAPSIVYVETPSSVQILQELHSTILSKQISSLSLYIPL